MAGSAGNRSARPRGPFAPAFDADKKRPAPTMAIKRLPWLDGGSGSTTPAATRPPTRRPTLASPSNASQESTNRARGPSPASRRTSQKSPPVQSARSRWPTTARKPSTPTSKPIPQSLPLGAPSRKSSVIPDVDQHENPFEDPQPRTGTPVSAPASPRQPETPDTTEPVRRGPNVSSPPRVTKSFQGSPNHPIPRRLSSTIEGLEELVQEAADAAENTNDPAQVEELHDIIDDARQAVQEAAKSPPQRRMTTVSPLGASPLQNFDFSSSEDSEVETGPPVQPRDSYLDPRKASNAVDWAYQPKDTSPNSETDAVGARASPMSMQSDLLLPPQPTQTAPRGHVDFVLRPTIPREKTPKRPHKRRTTDSEDSGRIHLHTINRSRSHRRQPIARNWTTGRKRLTASIACINTTLLGIIVGIYAGEVPRIQYVLADEYHHVIVGNVVLYLGLALSTFFTWTLPLLHGRKPYILAGLALALPLQFPQALIVSTQRSPLQFGYVAGLLVSRGFSGIFLGFANVNYITTLLDLFGASLQSKNPHQEFVVVNDVRRHGGGMGIWLGIWSWCSIGSLAIGFQIGAGIIASRTPDWGFYVVIMLLSFALVLNIFAPETRRMVYRSSITEVYDPNDNLLTQRAVRGEVKLHLSTEPPLYWFSEVFAGVKLTTLMLCQPGFLVLALYLGWIYTQIVLVIVLLGSLLSRDYQWRPHFVGLGVLSIAMGALLAVPLTKAGLFSRSRKRGFRTDSMTFQRQVTWSSHMVRRLVFTLALPLTGIAYTVSAAGRPKPSIVPIVFAAALGFVSILAIAECHGLIMETFDTCDLQAGANTRHRLQSLAVADRRRRTNYSSFPRVSAGFVAAQTFAFGGAAVATGVGGVMTRNWGAQTCTGVGAGLLLGLTLLLTAVLYRFREVQVIPEYTFGGRRDTQAWMAAAERERAEDGRRESWAPVVIGNPSGKMRRMSVLELGRLSRWTEVRRLNYLIRDEGEGRAKSWR